MVPGDHCSSVCRARTGHCDKNQVVPALGLVPSWSVRLYTESNSKGGSFSNPAVNFFIIIASY